MTAVFGQSSEFGIGKRKRSAVFYTNTTQVKSMTVKWPGSSQMAETFEISVIDIGTTNDKL